MKTIPMWKEIPGPTNGVQPALEYYAPTAPAKDTAVVIFPGGAYTHLAPHEGKRGGRCGWCGTERRNSGSIPGKSP